jgi:hypothetical protein
LAALALDSLPPMAFLVVMPARAAYGRAAVFVFGWLVSVAIVVTAAVLAKGAPSSAVLAGKIAIGVVRVVSRSGTTSGWDV